MKPSTRLLITGSLLTLSISGTNAQADNSKTRIVVVPSYVEAGADALDWGTQVEHYRRIGRFISNQLVRNGFEVINPFAAELKETDFNQFLQRSKEKTAAEMTRKYATDVAYFVNLSVTRTKTAEGLCRAQATLEGEGYDSASRDLGVGVSKTMSSTAITCDEAIQKAEKEVADEVGRVLTAHASTVQRTVVKTTAPAETGVLQRRADELAQSLEVRLEGATTPEILGVFGRILNSVSGVTEAKNYREQLNPQEPQASYSIWRLTVTTETQAFQLRENIQTMLNQVIKANGNLTLNNIAYRYSRDEVALLKGIRIADAGASSLIFVVDRERMRDAEFSGKFQ